ncbi:MAG: TonB-dependent receptor [Acidobacteriia bacterium]|nr:TonB-dependent receptor [Terriglobia bacterium]
MARVPKARVARRRSEVYLQGAENRTLKAAYAISLTLFLACRTSTSQVATACLEGVIQDASGAVVQGARVSVVNTRTEARAETTVTADGLFAFPSLQPSVYTLTVEAARFRTAVVSNLELNVGDTVSQVVKLEVGAFTETVTVAANAVRVQNTDAQIARAITLRDIDVLPQLERGPIQLALFNPGTQIDPADKYTLSRVNGTRQGSANSKVDGIDANDPVTPRVLLATTFTNSDSVEEFRVVTSGGKAEYGRSAGSQIELITRSGGSAWHGNAYEYLRNTVLNANTFFNNLTGLDRPVFVQNRFGGSLGGPIRHDRTFFFANYEGRRTAQQVVANRLVPTPEAKAGLFRWKSPGSSQIQTFDIVHNDPRGKGIDPAAADILKLLPDPNNYDLGDGLNSGGFRFNAPAGSYNDQFTIKADHNLSSSHRVFFRWTWGRGSTIDTVNSREARFPGQPAGTQGGNSWAYSIGSDWAITSRLVNEIRVGYNVYARDFACPARLSGPMLLANATSWTDPLNPDFGSSRRPPVRQITDNVTIVRGRHTFRGGLEWRLTNQWSSSRNGIYPNVYFANTFGAAPPAVQGPGGNISPADRKRFENLYNDLLGRMSQVTEAFYSDLERFQPAGTPRVRDQRFHEYGYFFQDDWRLHPRLVLNLGLRYEFFGVPFEANGIQGTVDKAGLINPAAHIADLTVERSSRWYNNDWNNFAPRVGFAWDLSGDGKTALRGNGGVFYDRLIGSTSSFVDGNTPGFSLASSFYPNAQPGADVRVSDRIPLPQQPAAPILRPPADRSGGTLALFAPNLRTGYVEHYSLTLQREVSRNTVVEAGYVGTHGIKLFMQLDLNQPRIYEDFLADFRELQAFGARATPVPASNTLVRMFGSPQAAISGIGANIIAQGAVGNAADALDTTKYALYANAGVFGFYLRNFPQFGKVVVGGNDGRSYYDSFQLSLRRQAGALKFVANYTFSKSMDNISTEGTTFTSPIDNFNVRLNRARGDYDIPHAFNSTLIYTLPIGKGRRLAGGWDVGLLTIWQSGRVVSYLSGIATGPTTNSSYANYTGDRGIGQVIRRGDGVYWLTPQEIGRFSYPAAGEIGTGGRNAFRGPRFFNVDMSLVKKFKIAERHAISFRAEAYNLFNNASFATPNANLATLASFGKIAATIGNARILQMALRYDF